MDKDKVLSLAKLARIELSEDEAQRLASDLEGILGYVKEVRQAGEVEASSDLEDEKPPVRNVMREDAHPHERGLYTEKILEQAPARHESYIKVKKIL